MLKRIIITLITLPLSSSLLTGCGLSKDKEQPLGELSYEIIEIPSKEFTEINKGEFTHWYERNYKIEGLHSFFLNKERYLLLSAGEKPTNGYNIEDLTLNGTENEIEVKAKLHAPTKDEKVTEEITFPHLLIRLQNDERVLAFKGIEQPTPPAQQQTDNGIFLGQIDSNSIEIKTNELPENTPPKAFQLSEEIKDTFHQYNLNPGDKISYTYKIRQEGRPVIIEIKKLN